MTAFLAKPVTRRRALFIGAVLAAGTGLTQAQAVQPVRWRGQALGAHAEIQLVGATDAEARPILAAVEAEIARLEGIFSLYRTDSVLSALNRDGRLSEPPPELLEVLTLSRTVHRQTGGLFDPTVQPLFAFYAEWFSRPHRERSPAAKALAPVLARVGLDHVRFDDRSIAFGRPGMALTLNGIAQGYITDRVASLLRRHGYGNMLLDIGEIRAIGDGRDGTGWRVGIKREPDDSAVAERLTLRDMAVATSMMLGTTFDGAGRAGHILHPRKGLTDRFHRRASTIHPSAAVADAFSTAAILMADTDIARLRSEGMDIRIG